MKLHRTGQSMGKKGRQRGIALITALLVLALAVVLAAALAQDGAMSTGHPAPSGVLVGGIRSTGIPLTTVIVFGCAETRSRPL